MAKIFYSMAGEGRGHAVRVRVIVDELLADQHQITLFAPGDAYALLAPIYEGSEVRVHKIPGLLFEYTGGRVNFWRTTKASIAYIWNSPRLISALEKMIREEQPDLVIADFEPALPRAARRVGVPFLSLDHQHFLVTSDFSSLPWKLRLAAWFMNPIVRAYYAGQAETIVSSFYFPKLKRGYEKTRQIGVLLRPAILNARQFRGEHLVAYIRRKGDGRIVGALRGCGRPVRVYGLGEQPPDGNLQYKPINEGTFLEDLASCEAVVSTAGNQLVGEALYLGKPVLAMPESNNYEQFINAHFLEQSGTGTWVELDRVTSDDIAQFLVRCDEFRARIDPEKLNGNRPALEIIRHYLNRAPERVLA